MFVPFFHNLRSASVPVSLREYLSLLDGMDRRLVEFVDDAHVRKERMHIATLVLLPREIVLN